MFITTNRSKDKQYFKTNEVDKNKSNKKYLKKLNIQKESQSAENLDNPENPEPEPLPIRKIITIDKESSEDFLLLFRRKFDDIFKKIKGHEKIFEQLKKKSKEKSTINNSGSSSSVYLKKTGIDENVEKKRIIKQPKIDVEKVIEIQKMFKGHLNRKINLQIDRLKLRQCLVELFCLLLYGNLCKAKIRINFLLLKEFYITAKLYAGEELNFMDRLSFKLAHCYYSGTKINNLRAKNIGKQIKEEISEENEENEID